jgi:hypothetical protein
MKKKFGFLFLNEIILIMIYLFIKNFLIFFYKMLAFYICDNKF